MRTVLLLSFAAFVKSLLEVSTLAPTNRLDLNAQLKIFDECTIQIVSIKLGLEPPQKGKKKRQKRKSKQFIFSEDDVSYDLLPLGLDDTPLIRSVLQYSRSRSDKRPGKKVSQNYLGCQVDLWEPWILDRMKERTTPATEHQLKMEQPETRTFYFKLEGNNEFRFRSVPPLRRTCSVQIYIPVPVCKHWGFGKEDEGPLTPTKSLHDPILPRNNIDNSYIARPHHYRILVQNPKYFESFLVEVKDEDPKKEYSKTSPWYPLHQALLRLRQHPGKLIIFEIHNSDKPGRPNSVQGVVHVDPFTFTLFHRAAHCFEYKFETETFGCALKETMRTFFTSLFPFHCLPEEVADMRSLAVFEEQIFRLHERIWQRKEYKDFAGKEKKRKEEGAYFLDYMRRKQLSSKERIIATILFGSLKIPLTPNPLVHIPDFPFVSGKTSLSSRTHFSVDFRSAIQFLTCVPPHKMWRLSMAGIVGDFDTGNWVALIILGLATGILVNNLSGRMQRTRSLGDKFGDLVVVFTMLLTQGTRVVHKFRILFGGWILMLIILKECYEGKTIQKLTAPTTRVDKVSTFRQLIDGKFTLYSPLVTTYRQGWINSTTIRKNQQSISVPVSALATKLDLNLFSRNWTGVFSDEDVTSLRQMVYRPRSNMALTEMSRSGFYERELWKCVKSVYVDTSEIVREKYLKLLSHLLENGMDTSHVSRSTDSFGHTYTNWQLEDFPVPPRILMRNFRALFESGLDQEWNDWLERIAEWTITANSGEGSHHPKKIALDDNILAIFFIHMILLLVGFGIFSFNIRSKIREAMGKLFLWLSVLLLKSNDCQEFED